MPKASRRGSGEGPSDKGTGATGGSFPLIGQRIQQYDILELIGKGGFGEVYRAHDRLLDRDVAIKVLPREFCKDPLRRKRLIREARAASRLNHRNICIIHQLSVFQGRTAIVMEFVQGETLRDISRQSPLPPRQVIRIATQLASGLGAAHRAGIVHRDVKSSNIILNREGETKILDFGIAKFLEPPGRAATPGGDALTEEGSVLGSVAYMSPEQLKAERVDARSDLFSLGVVLYEMVSGTLPFQGGNQFEIAHAIVNLAPPPLTGFGPEAKLLQRVVERLLAKRPEGRYRNAEELLAVLRGGREEGGGPDVASALDLPTLKVSAAKAFGAPKLPHPANPLVGRETEISQLADWVLDGQTRLITLAGPGGVGKSSLALAVAHEVKTRFAQGAFFVPLAHTAPSLVVAAMAEGVGFSFYGSEEPMNQLMEHLSESESLVILDNFEHLVSAAGLVAEFLQRCPRCTWLVTSRERLNLRGERAFEVSGLSYPPDERIDPGEGYSAVDLFVERAKQCNPEFTAAGELPQIHEICRLTYGLPLGIELAAAWVRLMNCTEIVAEIKANLEFLSSTSRDLPDRHRTLATVFEYSWQLLDESEKRIFRRLSIFRGGFDRDAARAICGASVHDLLPLLDKSLLRKESGGRLAVHELLRKFAEKKLGEHEDDCARVRDSHSDYYAEYLFQRRKGLRGAELKTALASIRVELENIRHALDWALETHRFQALERCLEDLMLFFEITSRFKEGYDHFSRVAETLQPGGQTVHFLLTAQALAAQALFSVYLGRYQEATATGRRALALFDPEEPDGTIATGYSHYSIGQAEQAMGNYDKALHHMNASLESFRSSEGVYWINHASIATGQLHYWRGDEDQARECYLAGVRGCERIGDVWGMKAGLAMLGSLALQRGDLGSAKSMFQESLEFVRDLEDRRGIANCLAQLGRVALQSGEHGEARRLYQESVALAVELRDKHRHLSYLIGLSKVEFRAGDLARSRQVLLEALRLSRQSSAVPEMLEILLQIARGHFAEGDRERAVELLGLVVNHPGTRRHALREAREWLSQLETETDPQWVADLLRKGGGRELSPTVVVILGEHGAGDDVAGLGAARA